MTEERKGMLAASVAYSIFGLSYLFSKMAMSVTEPMILLCVRFSVTLIILNLLRIFGMMKCNFKGKNLLTPIMLGILNPVLYFVFENYGLKYTTTSFTGVISSMSPIFSTLLGVVFLHEKPNGKQWICVILSITGVMMMSIGSTGGENTLAAAQFQVQRLLFWEHLSPMAAVLRRVINIKWAGCQFRACPWFSADSHVLILLC